MTYTDIIMTTPKEGTGQIVECSFGWHDGHLYKRVSDRSDLSECWYMADDEESFKLPECWDPSDGDPGIESWDLCAPPDREIDLFNGHLQE